MARTKEEKYLYDRAYIKANMKTKTLQFNLLQPDDVIMLEWLNAQPNMTQYIKGLIREDMERKKTP